MLWSFLRLIFTPTLSGSILKTNIAPLELELHRWFEKMRNDSHIFATVCVFIEGRSVRSGAMRTSHPKTRTRRAPNSSRTSCDTSCPSLKTPSQVPHPVSPGPLPGPSCHRAHSPPHSSTFGNAGKNQERKTIRGDLGVYFRCAWPPGSACHVHFLLQQVISQSHSSPCVITF